MQKKRKRINLFERIRRAFMTPAERAAYFNGTREFKRWFNGWKRNALYKGKPLTRSMIRRVGSRERAIELGLIK